jgi:hypothetical protein
MDTNVVEKHAASIFRADMNDGGRWRGDSHLLANGNGEQETMRK